MKYIGSKRRLANRILPHIQHAIDATGFSLYLEPFVGGANVIDKVAAPYKIGADNQRYLVALLRAAGGGTTLPDTITREEYERVRDSRESYPDWYVGLVGFCASYKAKFFGGYANGNKSADGTVRYYTDEAIRNLKKQSKALSGIPFVCCDYRNWANTKNAVIYCDPPYKDATQYSSGQFDSAAFFEWCKTMAKDNVLIISEYEAPEGFEKIESFGLNATLGMGQAEKRVESIFTAGIGRDILKGANT